MKIRPLRSLRAAILPMPSGFLSRPTPRHREASPVWIEPDAPFACTSFFRVARRASSGFIRLENLLEILHHPHPVGLPPGKQIESAGSLEYRHFTAMRRRAAQRPGGFQQFGFQREIHHIGHP